MIQADLVSEQALCPVWAGDGPDALSGIRQAGVELALWRRSARAGASCAADDSADASAGASANTSANANASALSLCHWLETLPEAQLPLCQMELQPADTLARLQAAFDASGTPSGAMQQALLHDINLLVGHFADIVGCASVRLRLDAITNDACRRWHRDCVPLRLVTTYRGPGTEWLQPAQGAAAMAQPDENMPGSEQLGPFDVALFKGCGWTGVAHDSGIVHRSPRIAGLGVTRLVLVLNPPFDFQWEPRA